VSEAEVLAYCPMCGASSPPDAFREHRCPSTIPASLTDTVDCVRSRYDDPLAVGVNPLLDAWESLESARQWPSWRQRPSGVNPKSDAEWSAMFSEEAAIRALRRELVSRYSWAIPTDEALDAILDTGPVLEVGCGTGYWSALLRARGGDVIATDTGGSSYQHYHKGMPRWTAVIEVDGADIAAQHPDRTLLVCWPPMDRFAYESARSYFRAGGQIVAYVGEQSWGCTADSRFHRYLELTSRPAVSVAIPQWAGIHDSLVIHTRGGTL